MAFEEEDVEEEKEKEKEKDGAGEENKKINLLVHLSICFFFTKNVI